MKKLFQVQLKPGHPTGTYRRDGIEFISRIITTVISDPVELSEEQVSAEMRSDPWLEIVEIGEESPPPLAA